MMSHTERTRREFLGTSAATGLTLATAAATARAADANDRLSVGLVGFGQRGAELLSYFLQTCKDYKAELTAVCDIWSSNRERGSGAVRQATGREPKLFRHLEDMLAWDGL